MKKFKYFALNYGIITGKDVEKKSMRAYNLICINFKCRQLHFGLEFHGFLAICFFQKCLYFRNISGKFGETVQ